MSKPKDEVYLYILMRTDLGSLNPGKAIAQGSHAANQCVEELPKTEAWSATYAEWKASTGHGFGTCVVLGCKEATMRKVVNMAVEADLHAAVVHDPTYPLRDGATTHFIPLDTCAFLFGRSSDCKVVLDAVAQTGPKDNKNKPIELNWYP